MTSMTRRKDGEWITTMMPVDFSTPSFTVDFVRKIAYTLRDRKASREEIGKALRKYEVEDPDTQWGVGAYTIARLLQEVFPTPSKEQTLW